MPPAAGAAAKPTGVLRAANRLHLLERSWEDAYDAAQAGDLAEARRGVEELVDLRNEAGFEYLDDYAVQFMGLGLARFSGGEIDQARACLDMARMLAPESPGFLVRAQPFIEALEGRKTAGRELMGAVLAAVKRLSVQMIVLKSVLYPLLWALTLGLYITTAGYLAWNAADIMRQAARIFPAWVRGFTAPVLTMVVFCVPCLYGPVWCLIAWMCAMLLFAPRRTALPLCAGLLLAAWGAVIPVRESLEAWLANPARRAMLRVVERVYQPGDKIRLRKLLRNNPQDGPAWYVYGQLLRRQGADAEAGQAFREAERFLGAQPWTGMQAAMVAFLKGDYPEADRLFAAAGGAASEQRAAYWINYSKVKFQLRDPDASAAYVRKAAALNPALAEANRRMEERFGVRSGAALAEIDLPRSRIFAEALGSEEDFSAVYEGTASVLVRGFTPHGLIAVGLVLAALTLLVRVRRVPSGVKSYYPQAAPSGVIYCLLHLFPGLGWIIADRPLRAFASLSLMLVLLLPLLEWPSESRHLLEALSPFYAAYLAGAAAVMLVLYFLAAQNVGEAD